MKKWWRHAETFPNIVLKKKKLNNKCHKMHANFNLLLSIKWKTKKPTLRIGTDSKLLSRPFYQVRTQLPTKHVQIIHKSSDKK